MKGQVLTELGTHQNRAHWGNPSIALLSVYTQSGNGVLIHWLDRLLLEKMTNEEMREIINTAPHVCFSKTVLCFTLTHIIAPSMYLSTTRNFPALKSYIKTLNRYIQALQRLMGL